MKKAILVLLLICHLHNAFGASAKKPKLVVAIVVDQFRYDYLNRFRADYHSGLARLLERGAVFTDAHYMASPTVTAVGHSTVLTGATPSLSGIAGNDWFDRETRQIVTSVSDPNTKLVGGAPTATGSSPRRMLVSTLGDQIKMEGHESKVIGISIKDRSAILPAGHMADGAYWFDPASSNWVSSSYYATDLPAWVREVNQTRPASQFAKANWMPVDGREGVTKPFCTMVKGGDLRFCGSLEATPWGNELIENLAERALAAEKLGKHEGVDVLTVSFSSNDYIGHALGPDAPEVRDISIRTDRLIGKLLDAIDRQVGAGNSLVVLTADHGVAPVPEVNMARKMPGGRIEGGALTKAVQDALENKFGAGKWIASTANGSLYLNSELIQSKKLSQAEVEDVAAAAARTAPHIYRAYSAEAIMSGRAPDDSITRTVRNGLFRRRSGDIIVVHDPYYLTGVAGTTHGTPFNYDTHVPIIFMGEGIKPGSYAGKAAVNDIAPTLADLLGIEAPSGSIGRVLSEMYR